MDDTQVATIMIVDDEEMVTTALRNFLELETPHRILTFTSAGEALQAVHREPIEVAIADFLMPEMDGITFLVRVRERSPESARILLTGYADKENAIRGINEAGLYYYLEKPWSNDHLKLVVRNGIERCWLFRELDGKVSALESAQQDLVAIRRRLIEAFV